LFAALLICPWVRVIPSIPLSSTISTNCSYLSSLPNLTRPLHILPLLHTLLTRFHPDNLLARLSPLFPPQSITRIGHPARILPGLLPSTLDYQTRHSSSGEIVQDVRKELEDDLAKLGKGRKEKGAVKGKERYALYGEVRELRKE
jgi:superfamily I DNA and/or RNA helicase